jgi:hypothetical protein
VMWRALRPPARNRISAAIQTVMLHETTSTSSSLTDWRHRPLGG